MINVSKVKNPYSLNKLSSFLKKKRTESGLSEKDIASKINSMYSAHHISDLEEDIHQFENNPESLRSVIEEMEPQRTIFLMYVDSIKMLYEGNGNKEEIFLRIKTMNNDFKCY